MTLKIKNGRLITDRILEGVNLYLSEGKIQAITSESLPFDEELDAKGQYVSPGFIDIHTHGGGGACYTDGDTEAIKISMRVHFEHGTTTIFPTTSSCSPTALKNTIADLRKVMNDPGERLPHIPGIHLEGPYFSVKQCGAQDTKYMTDPIPEEYREIVESGADVIRRWDFAPERKGSLEFCRYLTDHGIIPAIAHSDATYQDILPVYEAGCHLVTHLYSGMSTITRNYGYRSLGVIESAYLLDEMDVEMISDGCHMPPELLRLIYKSKGPDRICMVTDSIRPTGMPEGVYTSTNGEGESVIVEDGVAKVMDRSCFAGSVATTDRLVRTCYKLAGIPLTDCIQMMTKTPARGMKLDKTGELKEGYAADIVIFDDDIQVSKVILSGDREG